MHPAVTIGLPFYNAQATLLESIRSVFAQSFTNWRLLLLDDGSRDGSLEIARSIHDPRVTVVSDGLNRGLVHRLNQLVSLTESHYFARMDADDLMHPERLTRQINAFALRPGLEIVGSAAYIIDRDGRAYGVRGDSPSYLAQTSIRAGFIHPTIMARTEWLRRNPYDPKFMRAEDLELWRRADHATVCSRLAEPLLFYREPLAPSVAKYRASCRSARKAVRGPSAIAALYAKEWLYVALSPTPLFPALIRRRNRPCTPAELRTASTVLADMAQVSL